ncbi:MAG: nuclear transport factor 2 family protein [Wenzhouxiangella sp.]|nr:MAG: nuclear transport factor 2 family protein [Wenzhouxiangella sp.]
MATSFKLMVTALLVTALVAISACGGRGGMADLDIIDGYEQAMTDFPGSTRAIDEGLARFKASYADLTSPTLADDISATYASTLYFNDTLHTFSKLEDLAAYMKQTGSALSESSVDVHQVIRDGADVYVRWTMEFKSRAVGRNIHSRSIGVSHLRFDEEGRVVLHQDFWDSGHALYAHLPIVGFFVRRARSAL